MSDDKNLVTKHLEDKLFKIDELLEAGRMDTAEYIQIALLAKIWVELMELREQLVETKT